jgi:hypothetical protein
MKNPVDKIKAIYVRATLRHLSPLDSWRTWFYAANPNFSLDRVDSNNRQASLLSQNSSGEDVATDIRPGRIVTHLDREGMC